MEILEVSNRDYFNTFNNQNHIFISKDFVELNKNKLKEVKYLVFKEKKVQLGIILGFTGFEYVSPLLAPYGGFNYSKEGISIDRIDKAVDLLVNFAIKNKKPIKITFPPLFYSNDFYNKCINAFNRSKFKLNNVELNHQLILENQDNYIEGLTSSARNKLKSALNFDFKLSHDKSKEFTERAYNIIKQNRENKGYPLRMSFEDIYKTINLIKADFFILQLENKDIAAAMNFYVAKDIVQIIYWGDLPGYTQFKPMNYLAYKLINHYKDKKIKVLDIGPSTENSFPNVGLVNFKESIGCSNSLKFSYTYNYSK